MIDFFHIIKNRRARKARDRWVERLRSGELTQIYNTFSGEFNEYCAVGVWLYCVPKEGTKLDLFLEGRIINMNDTARRSFPEIADWIKNNVIPRKGTLVDKK